MGGRVFSSPSGHVAAYPERVGRHGRSGSPSAVGALGMGEHGKRRRAGQPPPHQPPSQGRHGQDRDGHEPLQNQFGRSDYAGVELVGELETVMGDDGERQRLDGIEPSTKVPAGESHPRRRICGDGVAISGGEGLLSGSGSEGVEAICRCD